MFSLRLNSPVVSLSGPNAKSQTRLYGDHRYHLDRDELRNISEEVGLQEVGYIEHDDLAPPVGFFGEEEAMRMSKGGVNIIVYEHME